MSPTVSVLLPSRRRPESLRRSVASLLDLAASPDDITILVAFDPDDEQTAEIAYSLGLFPVSFPKRHGYSKLHLYYNRLAELSRSDWLLLWNDDAFMQTKHWDKVIAGFDPAKLAVLSPSSTGVGHSMCCFPVMSRALYQCLGHMSFSCHVDSWLQDLAMMTGLLHRIPVDILHDRFDFTGGHDDETYAESSRGYQTQEFYSQPMQDLLHADMSKVRGWLT